MEYLDSISPDIWQREREWQEQQKRMIDLGKPSFFAEIYRNQQSTKQLFRMIDDTKKLQKHLEPAMRMSADMQRVRDMVLPSVKLSEEFERHRQAMMPISLVVDGIRKHQDGIRPMFAEMQNMRDGALRASTVLSSMEKTNEAMRAMKQMADIWPSRHLDNIYKNTDLMQSVFYGVNALNSAADYGGIRALNHERARMPISTSLLGAAKSLMGGRLLSEEYLEIDYDLSVVTDIEEEPGRIITPPYIITEARNIKAIINEIYKKNAKLFTITPRNFEELIQELLLKRGFKAELTKQTRDGGRDIVAISYDNAQLELKYLIECKKYAQRRKVNVDIIRSFCYTLSKENANKGIIFTTSSFTRDARHERVSFGANRLDLKDYDDIIQWVTDYIVGFDGR